MSSKELIGPIIFISAKSALFEKQLEFILDTFEPFDTEKQLTQLVKESIKVKPNLGQDKMQSFVSSSF